MPWREKCRMADDKRGLWFAQEAPKGPKGSGRYDVTPFSRQSLRIIVRPCRKICDLVWKRVFDEWLVANLYDPPLQNVFHANPMPKAYRLPRLLSYALGHWPQELR